ncbi:MAG: hypothetical protein IJK59_03535 [Firmicutes bacterium]|nr:hypothetical protein [Bacillota bacterium]MBQ6670828.1 hypothetical protein [Bacillota bacterium]
MRASSPCFGCPDHAPGCHNDSCPHGWKEYEAATQKIREAREAFAKTWSYESGRDRGRTLKLKARQKHRNSRNR